MGFLLQFVLMQVNILLNRWQWTPGVIKVDHGFVKVVSKGTTVEIYKEIRIENVVPDKKMNNEFNSFTST